MLQTPGHRTQWFHMFQEVGTWYIGESISAPSDWPMESRPCAAITSALSCCSIKQSFRVFFTGKNTMELATGSEVDELTVPLTASGATQ